MDFTHHWQSQEETKLKLIHLKAKTEIDLSHDL